MKYIMMSDFGYTTLVYPRDGLLDFPDYFSNQDTGKVKVRAQCVQKLLEEMFPKLERGLASANLDRKKERCKYDCQRNFSV